MQEAASSTIRRRALVPCVLSAAPDATSVVGEAVYLDALRGYNAATSRLLRGLRDRLAKDPADLDAPDVDEVRRLRPLFDRPLEPAQAPP